MSMEDFCRNYADMDICCLCPDFLDGSSECHWTSKFHDGRWVAGTTAGGCMNYRGTFSNTTKILPCNLIWLDVTTSACALFCRSDTFWTNPQYRIKVEAVDDECAAEQGPNNMLVSLMQKPDKRNRRLVANLHIGFSVFDVRSSFFTSHEYIL